MRVFFLLLFMLLFLHGCKQDDNSPNGNNEPPPISGWLYTQGNKIFTADGQVWQGKGANL